MRDKKTLLLYISMGLITIALVAVGILSYFYLKEDVIVVDFTQNTTSEIDMWAKDNKIEIQYEYAFDELIEKGKVISQSVLPETEISNKDIINIIISLGPDPDKIITLPDFTGFTYQQIVDFVSVNRLLDVTYEYIENDEIPEEIFIRHNIETPTIKRSDMVIFTLSLGESDESKEIEVPDFSTFTKNQINNWGASNNVFIKFVTSTSTTVEEGGFIKQSPVAGALIYERRTITVTYSSGEPIKAIDLTGKTKIQVTQWLDSYDNRVSVNETTVYNNDVGRNIVINNSPNSGYLADGATITVNYSLGKPTLSSFVGKDHELLSSAINELNKKGANLSLDLKSDYSNTVDKGKLISQDVDGELSTGTKITAYYSKGKQITLIDQSGKTLSEFTTYISNNSLSLGTKTEKYSNSVSSNLIISHYPSGGTTVDEGTKINYNVSLGAYTPEDFVSKTYAYTNDKIVAANVKDAGWTLARVDEYNNTYGKDIVYEQSISGKTLTVKVSKGSYIVVSNYIGTSISAITPITGVTFNLVSGGYSDSYAANEITNQSIAAGTTVGLPVTIDITYSLGEKDKVKMPDFQLYDSEGKTADTVLSEVRTILTNAGFTNLADVKKHNTTIEDPSPGTIWYQSTPYLYYDFDYAISVYIQY